MSPNSPQSGLLEPLDLTLLRQVNQLTGVLTAIAEHLGFRIDGLEQLSGEYARSYVLNSTAITIVPKR